MLCLPVNTAYELIAGSFESEIDHWIVSWTLKTVGLMRKETTLLFLGKQPIISTISMREASIFFASEESIAGGHVSYKEKYGAVSANSSRRNLRINGAEDCDCGNKNTWKRMLRSDFCRFQCKAGIYLISFLRSFVYDLVFLFSWLYICLTHWVWCWTCCLPVVTPIFIDCSRFNLSWDY